MRIGLGLGLEYNNQRQLGQLLKQAGCVLALSASKADGTKPRTGAQSPWVDLTLNANNATLNNVAGTASDGWVLLGGKPYFKADGLDTFGSMTNSTSMDITGTQNFAICGLLTTASTLQAGYIISKNSSSSATVQYGLLLSADGSMQLIINGSSINVCQSASIVTNTKYDFKVIRESGILKCWLNDAIKYDNANATNITPSQPNLRLFARSSNVGGTTHASYSNNYYATIGVFKGEFCTKDNVDNNMQALNKPYL